jgi:hypothetical protein
MTLEFDQDLLNKMAKTQHQLDAQNQSHMVSEQQVQADIDHLLQVEPVKTAITLLAAE